MEYEYDNYGLITLNIMPKVSHIGFIKFKQINH